ncbi:adenylate/guanylate cyclase domain-containing protein [Bradyrhizobium sp. ma5]|uniref:adenylate/guanylate cyclase domain-containing protein n=1 Tax=Bradyrhizobium sp. ma5 TaxID=3344828 RepID=UPI0035D4C553
MPFNGDRRRRYAGATESSPAGAFDPKIAQYHGRIVKNTGDGALVEFASVVDAVRCANEVQRGVAEQNADVPQDKRIEFRIGIHLGDIVIEDDDIFGDGVNIAVRLEGIAEPGGICISDDAHRQVRGKVDSILEDMGTQTLKNIAEPMRAWRVRIGHGSSPATKTPAETVQSLALPDKPSIAVLPFQNISGESEQEYFADGMVDDIITALSRFKSLFVIARNSSFSYKRKSPDIREVGRALGVRYVLEGSVRKAGSRLRITGQLIDAVTGAHVWADRFDGAIEDVFELQDQVTERVVAALAPRLEQSDIDRSRRKAAGNLGAYDCYLRSLAYLQHVSKQGLEEAMPLLRHAIELDPGLAPAYGLLLQGHAQRKAFGLVLNPDEENAEVAHLVNIVLRIGQDDAAALSNTGWAVAHVLRDLTHAKSLVDWALALNPNLAQAWANSGWINLWSGNPAVAVEHLARAMRHDPLQGDRLATIRSAMAHALFFLDKYDEAMPWAERTLRENPNAHPSLRIFAASAAFANMTDLARKTGTRLLSADPEFRLSRLASYLGPYQKPEFIEKYTEGLRLAGLPE